MTKPDEAMWDHLIFQHPSPIPENVRPGPYLIDEPSNFASTARWIRFRDGTLLPMIAGRPDDAFLAAMLVCIEKALAWRATIAPEDRFWKADPPAHPPGAVVTLGAGAMSALEPIRRIDTPTLDVAYEEYGPADGEAAVLLHGFPYDPRAFDEVAPTLAARGLRVIVPYLRGYGATRFLSPHTMRSGQQAALARDLIELMDALSVRQASLMGYDWGGRAACIVAALWPERAKCLVTGGGYNIQDIPNAGAPQAPEVEHRLWYQYYFHTARGRLGLERKRDEFCALLWRLWSPTSAFDAATYARTAASFDNPDFVEIVIHSYRHRFGYAQGDPALEEIEQALARRPEIATPTIALWGADDGVGPPPAIDADAAHFSGRYQRRLLSGVGHNIPQEAPEATVAALLELTAA